MNQQYKNQLMTKGVCSIASIPIQIPYLILIAISAASGWAVFLIYMTRIKRYAPEALVFAECRRKQLPLCELIVGNTVSWNVERPIQDGSVMVRVKDYGKGIDPTVLGSDPALVAKGGLQVYHRSPAYVFDLPPNHVRALLAIVEYARNNPDYDDLAILSDSDLIALVSTDRGNLEHNCAAYIDKKDSKLPVGRLVNLIETLQDESATLPLKSGTFSYSQGIRLNPSRFTPQNFEAILNILRAEDQANYHAQFTDYLKIGGGGFLLLIGVGYAAKMMGWV